MRSERLFYYPLDVAENNEDFLREGAFPVAADKTDEGRGQPGATTRHEEKTRPAVRRLRTVSGSGAYHWAVMVIFSSSVSSFLSVIFFSSLGSFMVSCQYISRNSAPAGTFLISNLPSLSVTVAKG
jgi:hypothetical protein